MAAAASMAAVAAASMAEAVVVAGTDRRSCGDAL
jgi:hypothetical protein